MVFEYIFQELGNTFGFFIVFMIVILAIGIFAMRAGLGVTALVSSIALTAYLFNTERIAGQVLLTNEWFITIIMLISLFGGFIVYTQFFR